MEPRALIFVKKFGERTTTFIYNEICELSKSIDVKVITTEYINRDLFPFPKEKMEIIPIEESLTTKRIKHRLQKYNIYLNERNAAFAEQLTEIIHSFKPTIIHCHFGTYCFHIIDNLPDYSIPVFISFHGYDASQKLRHKVYKQRLEKLFTQKWVHPIFVSHFMKTNVEKAGLSAPSAKILLWYRYFSFQKRGAFN